MNSKPKVLHVFHGLGMGGAETWIKEIIIWDIEENQFNFSIEILVTGGKEEYWDKTLKSRGIEIHYIEFGKGNINSFRTGFRTLLRKKKYLAIHDHQELFSGWHFLFGIGLLPKIRVAHFHNPTYQMNSNYGTGFIKKKKLQFGRLFIFLFATDIRGTSLEVLEKSGFLKKAYQKHRPKALHCSFDFKKYQTEGKAYNLRKMLKIDDDTKIVLIVGRFDYNIIENHPQNHKNTAFTLGVLEQLVNKKVIFVYSDNFLRNPFSCILLLQFVDKIRERFSLDIDKLKIMIKPIEYNYQQQTYYIKDQFQDDELRNDFTKAKGDNGQIISTNT